MDVIRDVPVEVYYDNENLVVTGVPETVDITIEGPTNFVQTTKLLKDFNLSVDLTNLPMGEHTVRIQPENISEKLQVRIDPATIDVVIEEKITQTFRVDPEINERLLAEDFNVVSMGVLPTTIEVTGAKSVIESISFVKATATGEQGINESFEQQARVRVLDRDLNKLNVTIDPEQVTVKVDVAEYNKEVPIVLKSRGTPIRVGRDRFYHYGSRYNHIIRFAESIGSDKRIRRRCGCIRCEGTRDIGDCIEKTERCFQDVTG